MTRRAPLADWEREHIAAAYRNGEKVEAIAADFSCSTALVAKVARAAGLPGRKPIGVWRAPNAAGGAS